MTSIRRPVDRLALRRDEAASALGMSVDHFDRYVRPAVPVVYTGKLSLYPVAGLQRWLAESAVIPPEKRGAA